MVDDNLCNRCSQFCNLRWFQRRAEGCCPPSGSVSHPLIGVTFYASRVIFNGKLSSHAQKDTLYLVMYLRCRGNVPPLRRQTLAPPLIVMNAYSNVAFCMENRAVFYNSACNELTNFSDLQSLDLKHAKGVTFDRSC